MSKKQRKQQMQKRRVSDTKPENTTVHGTPYYAATLFPYDVSREQLQDGFFRILTALNERPDKRQWVERLFTAVLQDERYPLEFRRELTFNLYYSTDLLSDEVLLPICKQWGAITPGDSMQLLAEDYEGVTISPLVPYIGSYVEVTPCYSCGNPIEVCVFSRENGDHSLVLRQMELNLNGVEGRIVCASCGGISDQKPKGMSSIDYLRVMPYGDYLQTPHWKYTRECALVRAGHRCQVCNSPNNLNVHHRTYVRRGCELPDDLTVLCRNCHEIFHKNSALAKDW